MIILKSYTKKHEKFKKIILEEDQNIFTYKQYLSCFNLSKKENKSLQRALKKSYKRKIKFLNKSIKSKDKLIKKANKNIIKNDIIINTLKEVIGEHE